MAKVVLDKRGDDDMFSLSSFGDDMSDDIQLKKKKFSKPKAPAYKKSKVSRPQPQQKQQQQQRVPVQEDIEDNTFEMFSNPQKAKVQEIPQGGMDNGYEQNDVDDEEVESVMSSIPDDMNGFDNGYDNQRPFEEKPSPGFTSIDEEKQDLIFKFHRLEEKGFKMTKRYNIGSDIIEMRTEYNKIKRDIELKGSLKFSRRMLMACVSGMEFLNKTYDPFTLELNGWSENVMENLNDGDYDNVFERLHDKYAGRVNAPPEMELMLSLAGSALMFHITSSMFKNMPSMGGADQSMMRNMVKNMAKQSAPDPNGTEGMKAPMDFSNMQNMFSAFQPPQTSRFQEESIHPPDRDIDMMSDDSAAPSTVLSSIHSDIRNVALSEGGALNGKRRGRKAKIVMSKENTIEI
tara:strand:+ start:1619 stop:2827 length:1209 start_codon:yes stop_codon:yes gene_type:complete